MKWAVSNKTSVNTNPIAVWVLGGPASGKSVFAEDVLHPLGFSIIDPYRSLDQITKKFALEKNIKKMTREEAEFIQKKSAQNKVLRNFLKNFHSEASITIGSILSFAFHLEEQTKLDPDIVERIEVSLSKYPAATEVSQDMLERILGCDSVAKYKDPYDFLRDRDLITNHDAMSVAHETSRRAYDRARSLRNNICIVDNGQKLGKTINTINNLKNSGYSNHLVYVSITSPELAIARDLLRREQGGRGLDPEIITSGIATAKYAFDFLEPSFGSRNVLIIDNTPADTLDSSKKRAERAIRGWMGI